MENKSQLKFLRLDSDKLEKEMMGSNGSQSFSTEESNIPSTESISPTANKRAPKRSQNAVKRVIKDSSKAKTKAISKN